MPRSFVLVRKCERRLGEGMEGENEWRWGGGGRAGKKRRCWIFLWSASNAQLQTPTIGSWSWRRDGDRRNQRSISVSQSSRLFNANRHAVDHVRKSGTVPKTTRFFENRFETTQRFLLFLLYFRPILERRKWKFSNRILPRLSLSKRFGLSSR